MKCSFCTKEIEKGTGLMYVKRIGTIRYYCSKRCLKFDVKMKKKPSQKEIREQQKQ
ncbi:MAG: 50S ribosomal protein L24e [Candidatus Micrarchaeota archaeon]|nr:50S ribosomal protein L24e [Candidatus Micrarchaeota archaeon]MDE1804183.1 50S ribosomal protein L24e [Candidatus Micrarchaeota archaeon]MDE1846709.1 50S ribosomal protein L24e [Candidatus Micrarchaeota archaeon]